MPARDKKAEGEADAVAAYAAMDGSDRTMGERIHEIIKENAPDLVARTWYGMPAYSTPDGKMICFYRSAARFNEHFATLGFNDAANIDDGDMWPTNYGIINLTPEVEANITALIKQAVS